ncbi:MAG TPA: ComEC/Rec2 family competence protein [Propionibacteriaceae bacterium]|nr:ComEC/Rec2 family competence protein [Propionibacteriaceae bacterium]
MSASEQPPSPTVDVRLVPLAVGAWAGAWWGTAESWSAPALLLTVGALAASVAVGTGGRLRERRRQLAAILVTLVVAGGCGLLRLGAVQHTALTTGAAAHSVADLVVVVTGDPVSYPASGTRPAFVTVPAQVRSVTIHGSSAVTRVPVTLTGSGDAASFLTPLAVGQRATIAGALMPREPGQPVAAGVRVLAPPARIVEAGVVDRAANRFRVALAEAMRWAPAAQAHLVPSLVVGDTSSVDSATQDAFRATGLTHLMAVSGANLALTLAWLLGLARWLGLRAGLLDVVAVVGVAAFVVVCRGEPSVLRAAAMGLVTLAALGRHAAAGRGLRHLAAASLVVLLLDPWLARSVGFALSVAATGGIIWWAGAWGRRAGATGVRWLTPIVFVPLAAQVATQPIVTAISGGVSTVGVVANALAAPFVAPVTVVGLMAAFAQLLWPPLGAAVGWVAGACMQPIIWIARLLASTPGAVWPWPVTPLSIALLGVACLLLAALVPHVAARPGLTLAVLLALALTPWLHPRPLGWPGSWDVVFCDVGQGDATVVRAGPGEAVLVDAGPDDDSALTCLRSLGVTRLPLVLLTHFHADHSGGLARVLRGVPTGRIWVNPAASPAADVRRVAEAAASTGTPLEEAPVGASISVGMARVDLLYGGPLPSVPAADDEGESSAENNTSLVLRVASGGLTVLVAGDAETEEQQQVLDEHVDVRAAVWKMPHHGSSRQCAELWRAAGARVAVASAGLHNDYGHPAPAALRLAAQLGMTVARTDQQASIAIRAEGGRLRIRTQASGRG